MEILKAENIYKSFGENKVLKGASLTLNKGEIVSLLGVSGGGKTTLFNVLSGISKPDSGRACYKQGKQKRSKRAGRASFQNLRS